MDVRKDCVSYQWFPHLSRSHLLYVFTSNICGNLIFVGNNICTTHNIHIRYDMILSWFCGTILNASMTSPCTITYALWCRFMRIMGLTFHHCGQSRTKCTGSNTQHKYAHIHDTSICIRVHVGMCIHISLYIYIYKHVCTTNYHHQICTLYTTHVVFCRVALWLDLQLAGEPLAFRDACRSPHLAPTLQKSLRCPESQINPGVSRGDHIFHHYNNQNKNSIYKAKIT